MRWGGTGFYAVRKMSRLIHFCWLRDTCKVRNGRTNKGSEDDKPVYEGQMDVGRVWSR